MTVAAQNVIGGIVIGGKDAYWRIADLLKPEDFPSVQLASMYRVLSEMAEGPGDLDVVTAYTEAARQGIDGSELIDIANHTASSANIRAYAELVKQDAQERRVRAICTQGAKSGDVGVVQSELAALLSTQAANAVPAAAVLARMWAAVMERYDAKDELAGLQTGFPLIDTLTGGLQPGRVYGIGARAKMGKTTLAMNICANVACPPMDRDGELLWPAKSVGVWSLEMADEELMQRMVCALAGSPSVLMQRPKMLDSANEEMSKLNAAIKRLKLAPLYIADRTDVTIEQIEAQARQMHSAGKLDLLCIDYLGLLRLPVVSRHDLAIAHATRRVKIIAKELKIPVILVFQLNRGSESNGAVRFPRPSDARDSGAIEQDLDAMFLLHRPSYYDKKAPKGMRLDLAIQRNGPTGLIHLHEELDKCRFTGGVNEWQDANPNSEDHDL
jgi:replicative DNA helicase